MADPENLEPRVSALESQMSELTARVRRSERDAAAARVLAGGADRDVEQLRGEMRDLRQTMTSGFKAMREDFTDLRAHVDRGFAEMDRGFVEVGGRLDMTAAGLQHVVEILTTLIERSDGPGSDPS
jgi:hypothetical protein